MFWPFLYQIQKVFFIQLVTEKWTILWLANLEPFTNHFNQHCRLGYSCLSFPLSYIYLFAVSILCSSNLSFGKGRPKTWITQKATLIKVTCTHRFWNWWSVISNGRHFHGLLNPRPMDELYPCGVAFLLPSPSVQPNWEVAHLAVRCSSLHHLPVRLNGRGRE